MDKIYYKIFKTFTVSIIIYYAVFHTVNSIYAKSLRRIIPTPNIDLILDQENTKGGIIKVRGTGFIKNYPDAHKIVIRKIGTENVTKDNLIKNNLFRLKVVSVNGSELSAQIPPNIEYGDYQLFLRLKTRFLQSELNRADDTVLIRPPAPPKPELSFSVIDSLDQIKDLQIPSTYNGIVLNNIVNSLKSNLGDGLENVRENNASIVIGRNTVQTFYIEEGFFSLLSEVNYFYYLPAGDFESELQIESESPLLVYALKKIAVPNSFINSLNIQDLEDENDNKINVSEPTQYEYKDLTKYFYLVTPKFSRYLQRSITLSPVFIESVHVTGDEFAILTNRSNTVFQLQNCFLSDSTKDRYHFGLNEIITAHSSLRISANLGLNDTGGDSLSLTCGGNIVDKLNYTDVDVNGFGIK